MIKQNNFIVRESGWINFLFSFLFFAMFIGSLITINFAKDYSIESYRYILHLTIIPAILLLVNGIKKNKIIELNKTGIFYRGTLITIWQNFVRAYITQEEIPGSLNDNFRLIIEYYVPEKGMNYITKLKMSSSQDKSEEQIMAAIKDFLNEKENYNHSLQ